MAYDDSQILDAPHLIMDEGRLLLLHPFTSDGGAVVEEIAHPETGEMVAVKLGTCLNEANEVAQVDVWEATLVPADDPPPKEEAKPKVAQPSLGLGEPPPEAEHQEGKRGTSVAEDRGGPKSPEDAGASPAPVSPKKKVTRKKAARKATRQATPKEEPAAAATATVLVGNEIANILPASYHKAPESTRRAGVSLAHVIQESTPVIQSVLPPELSLARLHAVIGATLLAKNAEALAKCGRLSIAQALTRCATDGLVPDGEEAYIVPMPPPFGEGPMIATYIAKAQGIIRAFAREGVADKHRPCQGFEVFDGDHFIFDTLEGLTAHIPWALRKKEGEGAVPPRPKKQGEKLGWFVRWRFPDKTQRDSFIPQADVLKRRDMSPMYRNERSRPKSPWNQWEKEMEWKTAVRISTKEIPKPTMLSRLLARDYEPGGADDPDWVPPATDGTPAEHQLGAGTPDPMDSFEAGQ